MRHEGTPMRHAGCPVRHAGSPVRHAGSPVRKIVFFLSILLVAAALAESGFVVNGRDIEDMDVEELYALEDSVMFALQSAFLDGSTVSADGELIGTYVINPSSKKFHYPYCYSAVQIGPDRKLVTCAASELVDQGYKPCGQCDPYPEG